jgi:hypothetical protein
LAGRQEKKEKDKKKVLAEESLGFSKPAKTSQDLIKIGAVGLGEKSGRRKEEGPKKGNFVENTRERKGKRKRSKETRGTESLSRVDAVLG